MKLLLDTQITLWWLTGSKRLKPRVKRQNYGSGLLFVRRQPLVGWGDAPIPALRDATTQATVVGVPFAHP